MSEALFDLSIGSNWRRLGQESLATPPHVEEYL